MADREMNVRIGADLTPYEQAMGRMKALTQQSLGQVQQLYTQAASGYGQALAQFQRAGGAEGFEALTRRNQELALSMVAGARGYASSIGMFMSAARPMQEVIREQATLLQQRWVGALTAAGAAAEQFSSRWYQIGRSLTAVGIAVGAVGAALTGGIVLAIRDVIKFEEAFAGVRKTVEFAGLSAQQSEEAFGQLATSFRRLATETGIAATEFARIGQIGGQLGVRGVEDLTKFAETVAKVGVATGLTTEEIATGFAQIAGILNEPIKSIDRMGDVLVELGNKSKTNEGQILEFTKRIAGAGGVIGLTSAQLMGLSSAFASTGIQAEAGGTAVQEMFLQMHQAVQSGSGMLNVFAKTAALTGSQAVKTAEDFKHLFSTDPLEAFILFVEGLGKSGKQASVILDAMGLDGARMGRAFLSSANATGVLNKDIGLLREQTQLAMAQFRTGGATTEEFNKRIATTAQQFKILLAGLTDVGITIGTMFLGPMKIAISAMQTFVNTARQFPLALDIGGVAVAAAGSFLAIGGGLTLLSGLVFRAMAGFTGLADVLAKLVGSRAVLVLVEAFLTGSRAIGAWIPGLGLVGGLLKALGATLAAIGAGPILLFVAGLAATGAALYLLITRTEAGAKAFVAFKQTVLEVWEGLKAVGGDAWAAIAGSATTALQSIRSVAGQVWAAVKAGAMDLGSALLGLVPAELQDLFKEKITSLFSWLLEEAKTTGPKVARFLLGFVVPLDLIDYLRERGRQALATQKATGEQAVAQQRALGDEMAKQQGLDNETFKRQLGARQTDLIVFSEAQMKREEAALERSTRLATNRVDLLRVQFERAAKAEILSDQTRDMALLANEATLFDERQRIADKAYGRGLFLASKAGKDEIEMRAKVTKEHETANHQILMGREALTAKWGDLDLAMFKQSLAMVAEWGAKSLEAQQRVTDGITTLRRDAAAIGQPDITTALDALQQKRDQAAAGFAKDLEDGNITLTQALEADAALWALYYVQVRDLSRPFWESEEERTKKNYDALQRFLDDSLSRRRLSQEEYDAAIQRLTGKRFAAEESARQAEVQVTVDANLAKLKGWDDTERKRLAIEAGTIQKLQALREQDMDNAAAIAAERLKGFEDASIREIEIAAKTADAILRQRDRELNALRALNGMQKALAIQEAATYQQRAQFVGDYAGFVIGTVRLIGAEMDTVWEGIDRMLRGIASSMTRSLSDLFFNVITGETKSLMDVFKQLGQSMLRTITDFLASAAVKAFLGFLSNVLFGSSGGGGITIGGTGGSGGGFSVDGSTIGGAGGLLGGVLKVFGGGSNGSGAFVTPNTSAGGTIVGGNTGAPGIFDAAGNFSGTTGGFDWGGATLGGTSLDTSGFDFGNFDFGSVGAGIDYSGMTTVAMPLSAGADPTYGGVFGGDVPTGAGPWIGLNDTVTSSRMLDSAGGLFSGAAGAANVGGGLAGIYQGSQSGNPAGIGLGTLQAIRGISSLASTFPEQTSSGLSSLGFAGGAGTALTAVGGAAGALAGLYGIYQGIQTGGAIGAGQIAFGTLGAAAGTGALLSTGLLGGTAAVGTAGAAGFVPATGLAAAGGVISGVGITLAPIAAVGAIAFMNMLHKEQERVINQTQESAEIRRAFDEALPKLQLAAAVTAGLGEINAMAPDAQLRALQAAFPIMQAGIATISPISNLLSTGGTGGAASQIKELGPEVIATLQQQIAPLQVASVFGYMRVADALAARGVMLPAQPAGTNEDFLGLVRQLQQYAGLPAGFDPLDWVSSHSGLYDLIGPGNLERSALGLFGAMNPGFASSDAAVIGSALPQIALPAGTTQAALDAMAQGYGTARAGDLQARLAEFMAEDVYGRKQLVDYIVRQGDIGALMRIGMPGFAQAYMSAHGISTEDLFRVAPGLTDMTSGLGLYHEGGLVRGSGEVPVLAEGGEIVMNRRAAALHYDDLMAWNEGRDGSGTAITVNITIQGDAKDPRGLAEQVAREFDEILRRRNRRSFTAGDPRL